MMRSKSYSGRRRASVVAMVAVLCSATAWVLSVGELGAPEPRGTRLIAALQAQSPSSAPSPNKRPTMIERAPLQILEDPYMDLSGVAVDPVRNEIVLVTGQRAAHIMVYNRLANTSPGATLHEPKRMISGPKTKIGAPGIYVDQITGEIYSVDTTHGFLAGSGDRMVVFSRTAEGNVAPDRELLIPHRGFAIAMDEEAQELFLSVQNPPAVVVYAKTAKGNEAPLRILEGSRTLLADVRGIALDTKNQWMYVANRGGGSSVNAGMGWSGVPILEKGGTRTWTIPTGLEAYLVPGSGRFTSPSITVYSSNASGDTPPLRVIRGPKTQLSWPAFIALDVERQELYVANSWEHSILVFRATDSGNVAPIRVLKGISTGLDNPYGVVVDEKNGELVVANYGNHTATVYPQTAAGNTPPIRTIRMAPQGTQVPIFQHLSAVDYDSKREEILVQSCIAQPQLVAFAKGARSGDRPVRILAGEATRQGRGMHDMRYDAVHDEIVIANPTAQAVLTFRGGASGNEPPIRVIQGPRTQLVKSDYVEIDPVHDELFVPEGGRILVFPRTANGDVAPIRVIEGPDTGLRGPLGGFLSVDPIHDLIVVPNRGRILIFNRTATGNVKPKAVIESSQLVGIRHLRVYPPTGLIVTVLGGKSKGVGQDEMTAIAVWSIHDDGNVPPLMIFTDPEAPVPGRKLAFNPKAKEIIVGGGVSIRRYNFPEIF
ncbi:MAG: beta-propeller fold lactonase family protein [Acidobacteria bacterium]|nr:beta-propeller fold lactonase family protein [Acidobacteriota bacterium]